MIESVNALCWNPLELFCLFGEEESMGSPIIPVEPIEEITRIASGETSCIGNKCSFTTGSFVQNSSGNYVYFTEMYDIKPNDDYSFSILKEGKEIDRINLTLKDDKGIINTKSVSDIKISQILVKGKDFITFDWNITKPKETYLKTIEMNMPDVSKEQMIINYGGIENSYLISKDKNVLIIFVNSNKTEFYIDPTAGPNSTGTVVDDATVGTKAWSNPDNAKVSDDVYAIAIKSPPGSAVTHYLKATNFGFSIPAGATINGILVEIERVMSGDTLKDSAVKIVKSDGSIGTTNKADTVNNWPFQDTYKSYGSSSDLWGETWTSTDINDIDFGVVLSAVLGISDGNSIAYVDHIRITVYYTEGVTDTCTCPASGDWNINMADNCIIATDCNMQGNSVHTYGSGSLTITATIRNFNAIYNRGNLICRNINGCFG